MRTHTYSIAIARLTSGDWSVAIVQKTLKRGVVVDEHLVVGPTWCPESKLNGIVLEALQATKGLARDGEAP